MLRLERGFLVAPQLVLVTDIEAGSSTCVEPDEERSQREVIEMATGRERGRQQSSAVT
jgi:hypothetical protein